MPMEWNDDAGHPAREASCDEAQWIVWPRAGTAAQWLASELVTLEAVAAGSCREASVWRASVGESLVEITRDDPLASAPTGGARTVPGEVARRVLRWTTARGIDSALAALESQVAAARRRLGGRTRHVGR